MSLEVAPIGWELLDDPRAAPARVTESLYNIARANRWFGGAAAVRFGLEQALSADQATGSLTLLDVGTGLGDLPRMAVAWAARRGITLRTVGLERHGVAARLAGRQGVAAVIGDGGSLPFATESFDLVLLSQVVHHFAAEAIVRLLRECGRVARRAVIVADLRRSTLAALGFRVAGTLLRFDSETLRDGVTSLRRGFTAASLGALLTAAGASATVSRRPGARLVAVWHPGR
jgi:SAM-dependent methyltransferase